MLGTGPSIYFFLAGFRFVFVRPSYFGWFAGDVSLRPLRLLIGHLSFRGNDA